MGSDRCWWWRWSSSCNRTGVRVMWFLLLLSCTMIATEGNLMEPGCHVKGFTENVSFSGCVEFSYIIYGCSGYCYSHASPATPDKLSQNSHQTITSQSNCCDFDESRTTTVTVRCLEGLRQFTVEDAVSCHCSQCKKDL